jgi:hypothetical protein
MKLERNRWREDPNILLKSWCLSDRMFTTPQKNLCFSQKLLGVVRMGAVTLVIMAFSITTLTNTKMRHSAELHIMTLTKTICKGDIQCNDILHNDN